MGALSFKARFVEPVLAGLQRKKGGKRGSIRNFRKRPLKVGEPVYLYYAMRTKQCRYLGESTITHRYKIIISEDRIALIGYDDVVSKVYDTKAKLNSFARGDGFADFEDMKAFWKAEHGKKKSPFPYRGHFYKW
jgi:hypothetical protein